MKWTKDETDLLSKAYEGTLYKLMVRWTAEGREIRQAEAVFAQPGKSARHDAFSMGYNRGYIEAMADLIHIFKEAKEKTDERDDKTKDNSK